jgi:hypothetical protein
VVAVVSAWLGIAAPVVWAIVGESSRNHLELTVVVVVSSGSLPSAVDGSPATLETVGLVITASVVWRYAQLVADRVFAVRPVVGVFEQLAEGFNLELAELLAEGDSLETSSKGVDGAFVRDPFGRVFESCPALEVCSQRFAVALFASSQLLE